jgi:hypothetical protein
MKHLRVNECFKCLLKLRYKFVLLAVKEFANCKCQEVIKPQEE